MQVRRTNEEVILQNHEARIGALERSPGLREIYVDDRVLTEVTSIVTFTGFPSDKEILELTWSLTTDVDAYICMKFNAATEEDYRWRLFGNVTSDDTSDVPVGNVAAVIGGSLPFGETGLGPFWGRARFVDYDEPTGTHGIIWQGEGGLSGSGSTPDTFLVSGFGDPLTPLTQIDVFALVDAGDSANLVAPSRLTLTCY